MCVCLFILWPNSERLCLLDECRAGGHSHMASPAVAGWRRGRRRTPVGQRLWGGGLPWWQHHAVGGLHHAGWGGQMMDFLLLLLAFISLWLQLLLWQLCSPSSSGPVCVCVCISRFETAPGCSAAVWCYSPCWRKEVHVSQVWTLQLHRSW